RDCRHLRPRVKRLFPNGEGWRREIRVSKGACCDAQNRRINIAFPINRAAAVRAEVAADRAPAIGGALVLLALTLDAHRAPGVVGIRRHSRPGPTLTCSAITYSDPLRLT